MVKLRLLKNKDIDGMLEWMHSEESKSIFQKDMSSMTAEDASRFVENSQGDAFEAGFINFAVVDESDEYLGTLSLKNINSNNNSAEYAVSFRKKAQGTGAAYDGTMQLLKYAFNELNLHRVYLNVLTTNVRANRFYQKVGFVFEGTERDALRIQGEYKDLNWYSIIESEFSREE